MKTTQTRKRASGQSYGRMLNHGMDPMDFLKLITRTELEYRSGTKIENGEDFINAAVVIGDENYAYAEKELARGHTVTAGRFFMMASALYRVADYSLIQPDEEKLGIYRKLIDSFRRGKEFSVADKPIFVEIPFEHSSMPGMMLIPEGAPRDVPVVIIIPGATGYKEENYAAGLKLWERGIATLIFDGPGQGEAMLFRDYVLTVDNYEQAVKAAINFVRADERVGNTIALYGISYGGYLAARAACFLSDEIAACVSRGGCAVTNDLVYPLEKHFMDKFMVKIKEQDMDKAKALCDQMDITDHLPDLKCPYLVANSEEDFVVGTNGAHDLYNNAGAKDKELYLAPSTEHCADDMDTLIGSYVADWLVDRLH